MNKKTANLVCLLIGIIWGGGFIATDLALNTLSPTQMVLGRFAGAALLAWIPFFIKREKISRAALKTGIVSGMFLYGGFAFQTLGISSTEPGMNAFLTSVNVVLVPYLAWIVWKQKPDGIVLAASLICTAGIGFLSLSTGVFRFRWGDLMSLACSFFFAAQIVSLGHSSHLSVWSVNAIQLTTAALCAAPLGLAAPWPDSFPPQMFGAMAYTICLSTFLCYLMQTSSQKYTSCAAASILMGTESLWANVFSFLFLHQIPSIMMLTGGLLIFLAILLVEGRSWIESRLARLIPQRFSRTETLLGEEES